MSRSNDYVFGFPSLLEVSGVPAGTNVLVSGPLEGGGLDVALALTAPGEGSDEAALLVAADRSGEHLLERYGDIDVDVDPARVGAVDCSTESTSNRFIGRHGSIDGPGDLGSIAVEISSLYETLVKRGPSGVRMGLFSVSGLLEHAEHREVTRFVHAFTGRVIATEDLGVVYVDTARSEAAVVDGFSHFCDVRVDVRSSGEGAEVRVTDTEGLRQAWTKLDRGVVSGETA
ncbi:MAG: DUF7504 family protein [Halobacteriota archaeon]